MKKKKLMVDCTEAELQQAMGSAMRWLENHLPAGNGPRGNPFILLLASGTFEAGIAQYVSNGRRADCIQFLRETADRLERREDVSR